MATEQSNPESQVNTTEKRVLLAAVAFVGASLAMIAYATFGLGISVPPCIPPSQIFHQASIAKRDGKNYEIHYIARMWAFEPTVVRVPTGSTLELFAVSPDVTHGLQIAGTNVNLMVVPGAIVSGRVHFDHPGTYTIVCHEYCGSAHQNMNARIEVNDQTTDISAEGLPSVEVPGQKLFEEKGCNACHSVDGSDGVGPTLKGAWGSTITLTDGSTHVLDEAFSRKLLLNPSEYVVKGYQPLMPQVPLTDQEIEQLEKYLKDLK